MRDIAVFDRRFFDGSARFTRIGDGALGGKATGLLALHDLLRERLAPLRHAEFVVDIPTLTVITTSAFDAFVERNRLDPAELDQLPDDRIAARCQRADLPAELVGDLRALVAKVRTPLAVRSSSLLEDALAHPFAGVYATKMIPNLAPDADTRFRHLVEALKFVWASTWFAGARSYRRRAQVNAAEKMAVIVQEVVGVRHDQRFYPDLAGVARSYSFYRVGSARPEDGVVSLALGLGKTIVDGGLVWSYSPARPRAGPPFSSPRDLLAQTQTRFWAVNMAKPPAHDPLRETEYLVEAGLADAERDGTLERLASTYDPASDRLWPGTGRDGPRAVTFAPLLDLQSLRLNALIVDILRACEAGTGHRVEVEFALAIPPTGPARMGCLQVRPMAVSHDLVDVSDEEMAGPAVLLAAANVMGNGREDDIFDVVYVRPQGFDPLRTRAVAAELAAVNLALLERQRRALLIGFGRWGSSDPSLGIPVEWSQVSAAKVLVEATLPAMNVEPSQGSHFFHNISSFSVSYFCVRHDRDRAIDWHWLDTQPAVVETPLVRHVELAAPLCVLVDGRSGRGLVRRPPATVTA